MRLQGLAFAPSFVPSTSRVARPRILSRYQSRQGNVASMTVDWPTNWYPAPSPT